MRRGTAQIVSGDQPFNIGSVAVQPASLELISAAGATSVELKMMLLLKALAEHSGQVLSREFLLNRVWGDAAVGDENLTRTVYQLRKVLKDPHGLSDVIKTVPKRGYTMRMSTPAAVAQDVKKTERQSIVVLPLSAEVSDKHSRGLADGFGLDLTNWLSLNPDLDVAPFSTARHLSDKKLANRDVAKALGVRFLVSGILHRVEQSIRLRIELLDAAEDRVIWANKYDASLDAFYEIQSDVLSSIGTTIHSELEAALQKRIQSYRRFDLTAYEHLQAAEALRWTYSRAAGDAIISHLRAALDIDARDPAIHAALAVQYSQNLINRWTDDEAQTYTHMQAHLADAQTLDPNHPSVVAAAGIAATMSGRADLAVPQLRRAAALNPSDPHIRALLGWQTSWLERDRDPIKLILSAERDAPHHPRYSIWANYRAHCEFALGDNEKALIAFEESAIRNPNYAFVHVSQAFPLILLERFDEATHRIQQGMDRDPAIDYAMCRNRVLAHPYAYPPGVDVERFLNQLADIWPD